MADAFISYSRKDSAFVRRLQDALTAAGREAWVDWEAIEPGVDWMNEIRTAIDEADAFLFIISPDSVTSRICADELAYAEERQKRVIPLVYRDVPTAEMPATLQKLNWLFIRETDNFDAALTSLLRTLDTDVEWSRTHTRLLTRALEWERHGRSRAFLLHGEGLRAAEEALAGVGPERSPQPTPLQREYVLAGRRGATRTQQRTLGGVGVAAMILAVVAVFALVQRQEAVTQRRQAVRQQQLAVSRERAAAGLGQLQTDPERSLLLALEALKVVDTPEAEDALRQSVIDSRVRKVLGDQAPASLGVQAPVVAVSDDARYAAAIGVDGVARVWDSESGAVVSTFRGVTANVVSGRFSPDGRLLVVQDFYGTVSVWDWREQRPLYTSPGTRESVAAMAVSPDGATFVTGGQDGTTRAWDLRGGQTDKPIRELAPVTNPRAQPVPVSAVAFSPDGRYFAAAAVDGTVRIWDANTWQETTRFSAIAPFGHPPVDLVFNAARGVLLVRWDGEAAVRGWDWRTGKQVLNIYTRSSDFTSARFSPDGRFLLAGNVDGSIGVWSLANA